MKNLLEKLKAFFSRKKDAEKGQAGSEAAENTAEEKQPGMPGGLRNWCRC